MAVTQDDLDNLDAAIASGTLRVRTSDGKLIDYADVESLMRRRAFIQRQLTAGSSPVGRFAQFSR